MLSDERIIVGIAAPIGSPFDKLALEYQTDEVLRFARAVEREATAPLLARIEQDEALMQKLVEVANTYLMVYAHGGFEASKRDGPKVLKAIQALHARLEKKT